MQITNNLWQAFYALTGPTNRAAGGRGEMIANAPPGQYIIQYADLPYYQTPAAQTNLLAAGGSVTFTGNYTFADANNNGIPDAYEIEKFGAVDPLRTKLTDTDHDGLGDWGEFVAGTNPNDPLNVFRLNAAVLPNQQVRFDWPSTPGHGYRLLGSTNASSWSPFSDWLRASVATTGFTLPARTNGAPNLFRIEAQP